MEWLAPAYGSLVQPFDDSVRTTARHVRTLEPDSRRQALLIAPLVERLIWYRRDVDAYGAVDIALSPERMRAAMRAGGWPAMRGDCDDRAVYAASLAAALGIPYRFNESRTHAWTEVKIGDSWRSILANDSPGAAPEVDPWKPSTEPLGRSAFVDPVAREASLAWLHQLPVDPELHRAYPARLGPLGTVLLSVLTSSATGIVLSCRFRRSAPRLLPA